MQSIYHSAKSLTPLQPYCYRDGLFNARYFSHCLLMWGEIHWVKDFLLLLGRIPSVFPVDIPIHLTTGFAWPRVHFLEQLKLFLIP